MALWEWDEERLCQRCPSCPVCIPETEGMLSVCCLCPGVCLCDSDRTALLSPLTLLSWASVLQALLSPGGVCVPLLAALLQLCCRSCSLAWQGLLLWAGSALPLQHWGRHSSASSLPEPCAWLPAVLGLLWVPHPLGWACAKPVWRADCHQQLQDFLGF